MPRVIAAIALASIVLALSYQLGRYKAYTEYDPIDEVDDWVQLFIEQNCRIGADNTIECE
jgi:hypothetical protein